MNIKNYFNKITFLALILFITAGISVSQPTKFPAPRQEQLLNGLNVLIWSVPNSEKVTVKLRINKGAAFDQQDKEGTLALLSNILFPNDASRAFFEEDLGGSLEIITDYDFIQFNATSTPDKALDALQTLAIAVTNPQIDKETTAAVKQSQIEKVKELENDPKYVADRAVAARLLGDFPYGRPKMGTLESLEKIDFADLIFAKNRFLTSDNATLEIIGDVKSDLIYRAARRYFGGWIKSDEKIPATFRLPDEPDKNLKILESKKENTSEMRFAFRSPARNDKNYFASEILKNILEKRLQKRERGKSSIESDAYLLPGLMIVKINEWNLGLVKKFEDKIALPMGIEKTVPNLFTEAISTDEFNSAKNQVLAKFNNENLSDNWLDVYTYKLKSFNDDYQTAQNVKLEDVKSLADKLKSETVASVLLFQNPKSAETPENTEN